MLPFFACSSAIWHTFTHSSYTCWQSWCSYKCGSHTIYASHTHTLTLNITLKFGMHSHKLALKRNCLSYCERQKDIYKWEPKINDWKKRALTRKIINKRSDTISAWNCTKNLCWWVANKITLKPIKSTQQVWNLSSRRDVMNEAKTLREWERERKKRASVQLKYSNANCTWNGTQCSKFFFAMCLAYWHTLCYYAHNLIYYRRKRERKNICQDKYADDDVSAAIHNTIR